MCRNLFEKDIFKLGGERLLTIHSSSVSKVLSSVYPQYEWLPWKFDNCPRNYWGDVENQQKFVEWAGKELKIKEISDWYKVSNKVMFVFVAMSNGFQELQDLGGNGLLSYYDNSLFKLLTSVFPTHLWLPWKFTQSKIHYWTNDPKHCKYFIEILSKELNINEPNDWYKVTLKVLCEPLLCLNK